MFGACSFTFFCHSLKASNNIEAELEKGFDDDEGPFGEGGEFDDDDDDAFPHHNNSGETSSLLATTATASGGSLSSGALSV